MLHDDAFSGAIGLRLRASPRPFWFHCRQAIVRIPPHSRPRRWDILPTGTDGGERGAGGTPVACNGGTVYIGAGRFNRDMSLVKTTTVGGLREDATLQFRTEFFNAFNHRQFNAPLADDVSKSTLGQIPTTSVSPRVIVCPEILVSGTERVTKIDRLSFDFSDGSDQVWLRLVRRGASYPAHRRGKGTRTSLRP